MHQRRPVATFVVRVFVIEPVSTQRCRPDLAGNIPGRIVLERRWSPGRSGWRAGTTRGLPETPMRGAEPTTGRGGNRHEMSRRGTGIREPGAGGRAPRPILVSLTCYVCARRSHRSHQRGDGRRTPPEDRGRAARDRQSTVQQRTRHAPESPACETSGMGRASDPARGGQEAVSWSNLSSCTLRDIAGVLRTSGDEIDRDYIDRWANTLGLMDIWRRVVERVNEPGI